MDVKNILKYLDTLIPYSAQMKVVVKLELFPGPFCSDLIRHMCLLRVRLFAFCVMAIEREGGRASFHHHHTRERDEDDDERRRRRRFYRCRLFCFPSLRFSLDRLSFCLKFSTPAIYPAMTGRELVRQQRRRVLERGTCPRRPRARGGEHQHEHADTLGVLQACTWSFRIIHIVNMDLVTKSIMCEFHIVKCTWTLRIYSGSPLYEIICSNRSSETFKFIPSALRV